MRGVAIGGAVLVAAVALALYARAEASAPQAKGGCRAWVAAPEYRNEIAAARPLALRMKRAFAAPGMAVAAAADGRIVWSETCGLANREGRVLVRRTTQFRIGSVSKPITAAAAARLYQDGRLDVDADVRRYVPAFPDKGFAITARQLGGHLGGIRHYQGAEAVNTKRYRSIAASLAVFKGDPLVARPGEQYSYSSYGFNLLGAAVEAAAEKRFAAAVAETVTEPLAMTSTRPADARPPVGRTRFYEVTERRRAIRAPRIDLSDRHPSGGFLSTAEDLARLGIGLTDEAFMTKEAQDLLFTPQRTASGESTRYGFGFELANTPFGLVAGHTGNVVGGTSFLLINPRTRVVVAMTTNIGFVTAPSPPDLRGTPVPPQLAAPFIRRVLESDGGSL